MFINPYLLQQETRVHVERYRSEAKQVQLIDALLKRKATNVFATPKIRLSYRMAS